MSLLANIGIMSKVSSGGGTTPTITSVTTNTTNSNVTSHLCPMPAVTVAGQRLVIAITFSSNAATPTQPTGWTEKLNTGNPSGSCKLVIYSKVADGTEGGTNVDVVTAVGIRSSQQVYQISGATGGVEAATASVAAIADAAPDPPNLTPSWGSANTLWLVFAGISTAATVSVYPGSGGTRTNGHGTNSTLSCYDTTAGASFNPGAFTISTNSLWVCTTVGIQP